MQRILLKSKIHRAKITGANLYYEGSLTIDRDLMESADILEYEKVSVVNVNNGERFETYVIPGERGKREIFLNGAAARKGAVGDEIIIISYSIFEEQEAKTWQPTLILVDEHNNIKSRYHSVEESELIPKN